MTVGIKKKSVNRIVLVTLLAPPTVALCGFGLRSVTQSTWSTVDPAHIPSLSKQDAAMQRAEQIMVELKKSDFVPGSLQKLPADMIRLPDQNEHEIKKKRTRQSFYLLAPNVHSNAFLVCDLYARLNLTRQGAKVLSLQPSGFFIVGYRDGQVKRVPVSEAKFCNVEGQANRQLQFPGDRWYSNEGLLWGKLTRD